MAPEQWFRICRRGLPPPHEFEAVLWQGVSALFVVRGSDDARLGVASLFDLDPHDGVAWMDIVIDPMPGGDDMLGPVARQLLDHAFSRWNLRKVYASHLGYQAPPLGECGIDGDIEAHLVEFARHDGMYWDRFITAIGRPAWHAAAAVAR